MLQSLVCPGLSTAATALKPDTNKTCSPQLQQRRFRLASELAAAYIRLVSRQTVHEAIREATNHLPALEQILSTSRPETLSPCDASNVLEYVHFTTI